MLQQERLPEPCTKYYVALEQDVKKSSLLLLHESLILIQEADESDSLLSRSRILTCLVLRPLIFHLLLWTQFFKFSM